MTQQTARSKADRLRERADTLSLSTAFEAEPESSQMESLLRLPNVIRRTGLCRARVYALIKEGKFPSSIKVGASSMWVGSEIDAWIRATIASARASAGEKKNPASAMSASSLRKETVGIRVALKASA